MERKGLILISALLSMTVSCAERTVVVSPERPPGLTVASEKAVENGKKHLRKGHCRQAIHEFNKALEKNPRNFEALYWLGVAEGMCGNYPQAYDRLTVAVRYSPGDLWTARVYATIGLTLLYMGREDEAEAYFERARSIDPSNEVVVAKKHKVGKKLKKEGYDITLRWLD